jgi:hypothetical protein
MKIAVIFAVVLMLSLQSAFAISSNLKDSYKPGETVISEIYGNILEPITKDNVEFRRGHVLVPFEYGLEKLGEKYFLWFITPESGNNYTVIVKDITTTVSGDVKEIDYEKNFTTKGNLSDYSIKPGAIFTQDDFEISVSLNQDSDKSISVSFPVKRDVTLKPGQNTLQLSIANVSQTSLVNITIGKYIVPAYIILNKTKITTNVTNVTINGTKVKEKEKLPTKNQSGQLFENYSKYPCEGLPGKICAVDEVCSGKEVLAKDGICCNIGECLKKEQIQSGSNAWIGYVVAALVIVLGVFIWIKYKGVKKEVNPLDKIVGKPMMPR